MEVRLSGTGVRICQELVSSVVAFASARVPVGPGQFQLVLVTFVLSFFKCPLMLGVCIIIYETPTFKFLQTKNNNQILAAE